MENILTVTVNPAIDTSSSVQQVVANKKLRCSLPVHEPGGGGINVSRAAAIMGGKSDALFTAGGWNGQRLKHLLEKENLNNHPVDIHEPTRENFMIVEQSSGRQFRFGMPGPIINEEELERFLQKYEQIAPQGGYVVASGSLAPGLPVDFYARVAEISRKTASRLILDTSGKALHLGAKAGVYMLKPNRTELKDLTGEEAMDEPHQENLGRKLIEEGKCEVLIISLGAGGVLMVSKKDSLRLRAPAVHIKSRVGAGDSMVAGVVFSLAQGKPLEDALRYGVAAGTAAVMTSGTQLCRREDVEEIYRQLKYS
ncbi:MAG: 1-phosphofructokinase family hexose kinase [Spirochaetota bacterium]